MDHNQERRRGHFRGRRGPDRRGIDRRAQPPQSQQPRDQVDVEQIMRDIRSRIAQRQGVDFSSQQIQDLAARKLESILDPRAIKPSLLEALRRGAGSTGQATTPATASSEPIYTFEDTTIYDSHRGLMRFIRRLLNPLLKLFFNPNPLIRALHLQAKLNVETATREAERERRQTEWNALHYEIVQRLVTEISRLSLDVQSLTMRVESLNARVDFNDRRVRSIEGTAVGVRTAPRVPETAPAAAAAPPGTETAPGAPPEPMTEGTSDSARRRRRRRRGRRGTFGAPEAPNAAPAFQSPQPSERGERDGGPESGAEVQASAGPAEPLPGGPMEESHAAEPRTEEAAPVSPPVDIQPAESTPLVASPSDSEGDRTD